MQFVRTATDFSEKTIKRKLYEMYGLGPLVTFTAAVLAHIAVLFGIALPVGYVLGQRAFDVTQITKAPTETVEDWRSIGFSRCRGPTRGTLAGCCARAVSGHAAAAPPINEINSRRRIASPEAQNETSYRLKLAHWKGQV
jgi:hypothetical protein